MTKTAFIYHPGYELHDTGSVHPETSCRARVVHDRIQGSLFKDRLLWRQPQEAEAHWIEKCHTAEYRLFVEQSCRQGLALLDAGDTRVCPDSYRVALLASGGAMMAVDSVMDGNCRNAFVCSRPPGHHARPGVAMGFCLFDQIAVAARYAQEKYGLERLLIIDWDVHHGNGTEEIFMRIHPSFISASTNTLTTPERALQQIPAGAPGRDSPSMFLCPQVVPSRNTKKHFRSN